MNIFKYRVDDMTVVMVRHQYDTVHGYMMATDDFLQALGIPDSAWERYLDGEPLRVKRAAWHKIHHVAEHGWNPHTETILKAIEAKYG